MHSIKHTIIAIKIDKGDINDSIASVGGGASSS